MSVSCSTVAALAATFSRGNALLSWRQADGPMSQCAAVTIDGTCKVGANFVVVALHPMKPGATLMSSFLFNVALVRLHMN